MELMMIPKYSMSLTVEQLSTLKMVTVIPKLKTFGSTIRRKMIAIYKNAILWLQVAVAVNQLQLVLYLLAQPTKS
jgi:hypothetical protein